MTDNSDDGSLDVNLDPYGSANEVRGRGSQGFIGDLRARYQALPSDSKRRVLTGGVLATLLAAGAMMYSVKDDGSSSKKAEPETSRLSMGTGLTGDALSTTVESKLDQISSKINEQSSRLTAIEEGKIAIKAPVVQSSASANGQAAADDGDLPPAMTGAPAAAYPPSPLDDSIAAGPPAAAVPPPAPPPPPVERVVGGIGAAQTGFQAAAVADGGSGGSGQVQAVSSGSKKNKRVIYLPVGFMKATLLTGVDALTSQNGTSNPEPIMARVQAPAILPNEVKANLSGCFVIGNAVGSLAKERVDVRLVSLTCVDFNEQAVIDQQVKGYFVDADGKKGLSGKVVTRFGGTLARQFFAGTVSGVAKVIESTAGQTSVSPLGTVRTFDAGEAAKAGIAGGMSRASEDISQFYLELARQSGPVVEVGAGKDVVVVIQEGTQLELKKTAEIRGL